MTYTFLHRGVVIGESDLPAVTNQPGQRGGDFRPTPYGRTILPRVTCEQSSKLELQNQLVALHGKAKKFTQPEFEKFLNESAAGRAFVDVGRVLREIELRGPDGVRLEFSEISFCDVAEFHRINALLGYECDPAFRHPPPDVPEFTVSVVLHRTRREQAQTGAELSGAPGRRFVH